MKEFSIAARSMRYLLGTNELNPERIDRYFIRANSQKDAVGLHNKIVGGRLTSHHLRKYGYSRWSNGVIRPAHEGRGIWLTRDHHSTELIPVWLDNPTQNDPKGT